MRRDFLYAIHISMLMIRLQRVGRKNDPSFRVVLTPKTNGTRSGKFLEILGAYNPRTKKIQLKEERIRACLKNGAQTSSTLHNLLVKSKVIEGKKINVVRLPKPKGEGLTNPK